MWFPMEVFGESEARIAKKWWEARRQNYNFGLIIAGIGAFICYAIVGIIFIMPYDSEFEITLYTIFFQGIGYLVVIGVANLFYSLGYWADSKFNTANDPKFRIRLFNAGYWFSVGLPFLIPITMMIQYLLEVGN